MVHGSEARRARTSPLLSTKPRRCACPWMEFFGDQGVCLREQLHSVLDLIECCLFAGAVLRKANRAAVIVLQPSL